MQRNGAPSRSFTIGKRIADEPQFQTSVCATCDNGNCHAVVDFARGGRFDRLACCLLRLTDDSVSDSGSVYGVVGCFGLSLCFASFVGAGKSEVRYYIRSLPPYQARCGLGASSVSTLI